VVWDGIIFDCGLDLVRSLDSCLGNRAAKVIVINDGVRARKCSHEWDNWSLFFCASLEMYDALWLEEKIL
jgi:hypothetical protein